MNSPTRTDISSVVVSQPTATLLMSKQEGTAHFVRFSQTKTPMAERIRSPGEIEKMLLVKRPHLDRGYLCFWDCSLCVKVIFAVMQVYKDAVRFIMVRV